MCGESECLFVVGNTAYPGKIQCFTVTDGFVVSMVNDKHKKCNIERFDDIQSMTSHVIQLLKEWFPAKTIENS